jgi:hypothetical protein
MVVNPRWDDMMPFLVSKIEYKPGNMDQCYGCGMASYLFIEHQ